MTPKDGGESRKSSDPFYELLGKALVDPRSGTGC